MAILTAVCLVGLVVSAALCVGVVCHERDFHPLALALRRYRRLPGVVQMAFLVPIVHLFVFGSSKTPTNDPPSGASSTNAPPTGLGACPPLLKSSAPQPSPLPSSPELPLPLPPVVAGDVLCREETNVAWCCEAPADAEEVTQWRCRGAALDWANLGGYVVTTDGRIITSNAVFAVMDRPLSVVPEAMASCLGTNGASTVWTATTPCRSRLFTWQNVLVGRDTNRVISAQAEIYRDGSYKFRYDLGIGPPGRIERFVYRQTPGVEVDYDGDGLVGSADPHPFDADADGDGLVDGVTADTYAANSLWSQNAAGGMPIAIRLNEPVVPPAQAVLLVDDLRILLTTNALYRLTLPKGVRHHVKLTTNHRQLVNLSLERQ